MALIKQMKNVLKPTRGYKKKDSLIIKKAISRFISNTQKIVQKVNPRAKILINPPESKKPKSSKLKNQDKEIKTPDFNEIHFSDLSDSSSSGDFTDSETYETIHFDLEQNEYFVRARPEIRKVKANGRSTEKVHVKGKTMKNLKNSLDKLEKHVPNEVIPDYFYEGIQYLAWPNVQMAENLNLSFNYT